MSLQERSSILLIGPAPEGTALGGVAQHMRILRATDCLKNADIFDPGSVQGRLRPAVIAVILNCIRLRRRLAGGQYRQVWINTSIYSTALLKLLLILLAVQNSPTTKKRIFFHGGRFESIRFLRTRGLRRTCRSILSIGDSLHFLSREQGQGFSRVFPDLGWRLFCNYLPDEPVQTATDDGGRCVFLFVGRMVRSKGIFDIIAAIKETDAAIRQNIVVRFAGDGDDMAAFQRAVDPSLPIEILGRQDAAALAQLYAGASVLVLPSYHQEGFPYVVLEAMRAGLPIIATGAGAIGDLIEPGKNGLFVRPRDPGQLGAAMRQLAEDLELRRQMGACNREMFVRSFSTAAAETYYGGLIAGGGRIFQ